MPEVNGYLPIRKIASSPPNETPSAVIPLTN